MDAATLDRLADLVVGFGANVQHDQIVSVSCEPGKEPLVRAIVARRLPARRAVRRRRLVRPVGQARADRLAREETLEFVADWYGERLLALGDQRAARDRVLGAVGAGLLEGLDPVHARQATSSREIKECGKVVNERTTNWSVDAGVVAGLGARSCSRISRSDAAWQALWRADRCTCCGSTRPTRRGGRARADALVYRRRAPERAPVRRADYEGAGHRPDDRPAPRGELGAARSRPSTATSTSRTCRRRRCTSPDPDARDRNRRLSKPLGHANGTVVRGLRMRIEGGRAVQIDADTAQDTMQHDRPMSKRPCAKWSSIFPKARTS